MPTISAIKPQKRRGNRVSVFLDGRFAFGLNAKVADRFGLKVGAEVTQSVIDAVLNGQLQQECFDKSLQYLSRRMHSKTELKRKLAKAQFPPETIDAALGRLEEYGYINDEEFARQKLQGTQRKLIGERRAVQELMKAGVKSEVAKAVAEEHFSSADSSENARLLIEKKLPSLRRLDPVTAKRRLIGLLQRRGFDYDTIKPLIEHALGRLDEES